MKMDNVLKGLELVEAKTSYSIYMSRKTNEYFKYNGFNIEPISVNGLKELMK